MCRADLPPGTGKLFKEGYRLLFPLKQLVERSGSSWNRLTTAQRRTLDKGFGAWKGATEQRHADAQFDLTALYDQGQGVSQSYEKAVVWYRKAAGQGDANAQCNLGFCSFMYKHAHGVLQSYKKTLVWYRKAADQANANAQCNLGYMYKQGQCMFQNYEEAVVWFRKTADKENTNAQYNPGCMYKHGQGVVQSLKEIAVWHQKAADQGYAVAQLNLASPMSTTQAPPTRRHCRFQRVINNACIDGSWGVINQSKCSAPPLTRLTTLFAV